MAENREIRENFLPQKFTAIRYYGTLGGGESQCPPYATLGLNSEFGLNRQMNSRQYFQLYGIHINTLGSDTGSSVVSLQRFVFVTAVLQVIFESARTQCLSISKMD